MKIKEGTYINPSLVNIDYFWKYIANYTKDDLFKHKIKEGICSFINKKYRSSDTMNINYYRICKGCHWMQEAFLYLINKLDPSKKWMILYGDFHSCIINEDRNIVVDLYAKPYKYKTGIESLNAVYKKKFFLTR